LHDEEGKEEDEEKEEFDERESTRSIFAAIHLLLNFFSISQVVSIVAEAALAGFSFDSASNSAEIISKAILTEVSRYKMDSNKKKC